MRTYFLRYERQCATALELARFLAAHARVKRVFYPGLATHPRHHLALRQMSDFGAIVSFELDGGVDRGDRFAEALRYFAIAASLGSVESLVMPPRLLGGGALTLEQRAAADITPGTVRLSVGIEDAADLIEDVAAALDRAFELT
jgi:cystathionine beta-lyase/cystathionine gamma-synthase